MTSDSDWTTADDYIKSLVEVDSFVRHILAQQPNLLVAIAKEAMRFAGMYVCPGCCSWLSWLLLVNLSSVTPRRWTRLRQQPTELSLFRQGHVSNSSSTFEILWNIWAWAFLCKRRVISSGSRCKQGNSTTTQTHFRLTKPAKPIASGGFTFTHTPYW